MKILTTKHITTLLLVVVTTLLTVSVYYSDLLRLEVIQLENENDRLNRELNECQYGFHHCKMIYKQGDF